MSAGDVRRGGDAGLDAIVRHPGRSVDLIEAELSHGWAVDGGVSTLHRASARPAVPDAPTRVRSVPLDAALDAPA